MTVQSRPVQVRCAGHRAWRDRSECRTFGLGWVCSDECRDLARRRRDERVSKQVARRAARPAALPVLPPAEPKPRHNGPSAEKKRFVRERDGRRCRMCNTTRALHVHHVVYRSQGGGHEEQNLITLCLVCHDVVHSSKRRWQPVLLEVLRQHYEEGRFLTVQQTERMMSDAG